MKQKEKTNFKAHSNDMNINVQSLKKVMPMPISSLPFCSKPCSVLYKNKIYDHNKMEKIRQEFNRKIFRIHFEDLYIKRDMSRIKPQINVCLPKDNLEEDSFLSSSVNSSQHKVSRSKAKVPRDLKQKYDFKENYSHVNRTVISPKQVSRIHSRNKDVNFKSINKVRKNRSKKKKYLFDTINNSRSDLSNLNEQTFMQSFITKTNPKILLSECFDRFNKINNGKLK